MQKNDDQTASKRQVPAVTRAVAILRFLARSGEPAGVNPIARSLGLIPSTCLHILRVLQDEGLVEFDSQTKRYSMGIGILPLARAALQKNSFAVHVQPRLADLAMRFGVTTIATQRTELEQMVVVALAQSSRPFRLQVDLGSRFPMLISATGRLFAAFNNTDPDALRKGFERLTWDHPPSFDAWEKEVEQARINGYALDRGAYISGITVVAVPVFGSDGRMFRSLVAIGISEWLKDEDIPVLADALKDLRNEIDNLQISTGS